MHTGFHLEKWARGGGKTILTKTWGGGNRSVRDSAPSRGVWGHFEFIPSKVYFQFQKAKRRWLGSRLLDTKVGLTEGAD